MLRSLALGVAIGATCALAYTAGAHGSLSLASGTTAGFTTTLTGADTTSAYTVSTTVANSGITIFSGWNLQVTSTTFTAGTHTLPTNATAITAVARGSCTGSVCPTNSVTYPVSVPAGATAPAAVKWYNASAGTGTGTITLTPTFSTTVPGNSFAGTYTSTITLSVVSGP